MFEGLLLSRDADLIRMFRRIYQELEMELVVCSVAQQALDRMEQHKVDAIIVDCDDVQLAAAVLKNVRKNTANRRATAFAILGGVTTMRDAFDMGANLTLQKPVTLDYVRNSMRALKAIVEQEHRIYFRVPVDLPVTLVFDERQEFQAIAKNISDGGMALQLQHPAPEHRIMHVRFSLPKGTSRLEAKVLLAWNDVQQMAGVKFEFMPSGARHELSSWLARNIDEANKEGSKKQAARAAARYATP